MNKSGFFSLAEMKQPVNQWLCIAFMGVFCFWVVLYYFTEKTKIIAEGFVSHDPAYVMHAAELKSAIGNPQ